MQKLPELFDLSNFPKDSKYYCAVNKKVPGKMKDEYGGTPIDEFIGLKAKMNTLININHCQKVHIKDIILILVVVNLKMFCLKKKLLDILWKEWNLSIIKYILKKSINHLYLALMTSNILKMME